MKLYFFIFLIGIAPAYLNESETSQSLSLPVESNQLELQVKERTTELNEKENNNCPNNKVLVQTLQVIKGSLVQGDTLLSPEKFKGVLDSLIDYLNTSQVDSSSIDNNNHATALKNVMEDVKSRSKKEIARVSQSEERETNENLSGKITLQYDLPSAAGSDCQALFNAIINVIQAAYSQINTFCLETGKCQINKEDTKVTNDWVPPYEIPYKNGENALHYNVLSNNTRFVEVVSKYPQNVDLLTILQNYRPNSEIARVKGPYTKQDTELNNVLLDNDKPNGITRQKNSMLEMLTVLNKPSGYAKVNVDSSASVPVSSNSKLTLENIIPSQNIPLVEGAVSPLNFGNFEQFNIKNTPINSPDDSNLQFDTRNVQVNIPSGKNPYASQNILTKQLGYKLLPSNQNYKLNYFQHGNFPNGPKLDQGTASQQLIYNQSPYYSGSYYQQAQLPPSNPTQQKQNLSNQQLYSYYQSQHFPYQRPGESSQQNILYGKQVPYSIYSGSQRIPASIIDPRLADFYRNLNNSVGLNDLYRISVANGQKLNIAPNKNGVIELTFTLQRPQTLEYKPLYYVKYRLPYQTYMYNVQNLQRKPFLRSNTAKVYQDILAVANITESSQDLKDLDKEEISKLVATNGALVKAKILDESTNSVDDIVGEEVKNILKLSSKLGPEGMLNATKIAINNIEDATAINETDQDPIDVKKPISSNETSKPEVPNQSENPNSLKNPKLDSNVPYFENPLYRVPYIKPNKSFNYNIGAKPNGKPLPNPLFVPTINY